MSDLVRPPFQHRDNEDGSFDSICTRCFLTVASADEEDKWDEQVLRRRSRLFP
jgi:hypothetical protein